jgi:hypothetical protein
MGKVGVRRINNYKIEYCWPVDGGSIILGYCSCLKAEKGMHWEFEIMWQL